MTNAYSDYKSKFTSGDGGLFVKLDPDEPVKLRLASTAFYSVGEYTDDNTGETTYSDKYSWVVWNYDLEKAQILSKGRSIFNAIAQLTEDDDWGDPTTFDIRVTRTGTGLETRYAVTPLPNRAKLSTDQKEAVGNVDLPSVIEGAMSIEERLSADEDVDKQVKSFIQ